MLRLSPENRKRFKRFKSIRRGWYSLWLLVIAFGLSLGAQFLIGNRPLYVSYEGKTYFPAFTSDYYPETLFGGIIDVEQDFRKLAESEDFKAKGGSILMPLHPYSPLESVIIPGDRPPATPRLSNPCGTDDRGRDVFARIVYGFRVSVSFALVLSVASCIVGIVIGAIQAYFGGWVDLILQRLTEMVLVLPFLYVVLMVSSIVTPNFIILAGILLIFGWILPSRYIRAEVFRERVRDYATAAQALGGSPVRIMFRHLLPNSLTPILTYFPFIMIGNIFVLTSLDFLGFGLPPPTPSWGELFKQARGHFSAWWLTLFPFGALFVTLLLTTFVGEAAREAWDPRSYGDQKK